MTDWYERFIWMIIGIGIFQLFAPPKVITIQFPKKIINNMTTHTTVKTVKELIEKKD